MTMTPKALRINERQDFIREARSSESKRRKSGGSIKLLEARDKSKYAPASPNSAIAKR
jgi:hypothetical protein